LFLKKFKKLWQLTSGLAMKSFVQFLPYMGLNNKNPPHYTILSIHEQNNKQQQQLTPVVYTGYDSGPH